ncbi:MAG: hypothetical protein HUK22_05745 [Thermoguttaceae bacterium]|nr:hypothetical protein [Thermoguttaceae bacterium]
MQDSNYRTVLQVKSDGKIVKEQLVSADTVGENGWLVVETDLSDYAGKEANVEIVNQPNGWSWEAAYFGEIDFVK